MEEIMNYLAKKNGFGQDVFVLEEIAELQKELTKNSRGKDNLDKIIDEGADVLLTILILLRAYGHSEKEFGSLISALGQECSKIEDCVLERMPSLQIELIKHRHGLQNNGAVIAGCIGVLHSITLLLQTYGATKEDVLSLMDYKLNRLRDFLPESVPVCGQMKK